MHLFIFSKHLECVPLDDLLKVSEVFGEDTLMLVIRVNVDADHVASDSKCLSCDKAVFDPILLSLWEG